MFFFIHIKAYFFKTTGPERISSRTSFILRIRTQEYSWFLFSAGNGFFTDHPPIATIQNHWSKTHPQPSTTGINDLHRLFPRPKLTTNGFSVSFNITPTIICANPDGVFTVPRDPVSHLHRLQNRCWCIKNTMLNQRINRLRSKSFLRSHP